MHGSRVGLYLNSIPLSHDRTHRGLPSLWDISPLDIPSPVWYTDGMKIMLPALSFTLGLLLWHTTAHMDDAPKWMDFALDTCAYLMMLLGIMFLAKSESR